VLPVGAVGCLSPATQIVTGQPFDVTGNTLRLERKALSLPDTLVRQINKESRCKPATGPTGVTGDAVPDLPNVCPLGPLDSGFDVPGRSRGRTGNRPFIQISLSRCREQKNGSQTSARRRDLRAKLIL
jgi:hypothetical protein